MFFKIDVFKIFENFTGKHLSLVNKVAGLRYLKRLSIPILDHKKNYNNWKASFMALIDQALGIAEYKLLQ